MSLEILLAGGLVFAGLIVWVVILGRQMARHDPPVARK
jgi:hypothetical protein